MKVRGEHAHVRKASSAVAVHLTERCVYLHDGRGGTARRVEAGEEGEAGLIGRRSSACVRRRQRVFESFMLRAFDYRHRHAIAYLLDS